MPEALEVLDVWKEFGNQPVLRGVSFRAEPGIMVIIGLNGSGKSTLLKVIAGILKADGGRVFLAGRDISGLPPEKRRVGYVPQHPALFRNLTVWENVAYALKNGRGSRQAAGEAAEMLGLTGVLAKKPRELSGGYQSRVSLARALASGPGVILLDEPLSDVDAATKERLLPEFRNVLKARGVPVIYVTHDVGEAELIGDTFAAMIGGKLGSLDKARKAFEAVKELEELEES
jgi:molybdate transport system ATP-binding protein